MSDLSRYNHLGNARGKRGRPYRVASIDVSSFLDQELEFYNRFFKICSVLSYREIMALSRVLKRTPRTVQNWKYEKNAPTETVMRWVIRWGQAGRPLLRWNTGKPGRPIYIADVKAVQHSNKLEVKESKDE